LTLTPRVDRINSMIREVFRKFFLQFLIKNVEIKVTYEPEAHVISMPRVGDIGIDFYNKEYFKILPGDTALVPTGVKMQLPQGLALVLKDRSSVSKKLHVLAGVIDSSYRGEIMIRLFNHTQGQVAYPPHSKIAQGILTLDLNSLFDLKTVESLEDSERGTKGFGSTGK